MDFIDSNEISYILDNHGFKIVEEIGKGAQGVCYVIYSKQYNMNFVAKVMKIKKESDGKSTKMQFEREVYSLAHIIHKNIVKIYDSFAEGDYLIMIIEYCQNGSLQSVFQSAKKSAQPVNALPYSRIRQLAIDILSGLAYCHDSMHISHHDIKLHNILVDKYGIAKLCDFGLSQLITTNLTSTQDIDSDIPEGHKVSPNGPQNLGGSIYYMSPQLLECNFNSSARYDLFAADIWAFGITLYTLLTSKYPFVGHSKKDVFDQQITSRDYSFFNDDNTLTIFEDLPKDMPSDLRFVLLRSLEFSEHKRATAQELLDFLTQEEQTSRGTKIRKSISCSEQLVQRPKLRSFAIEEQIAISSSNRIFTSSSIMFKKIKIVKPTLHNGSNPK